VDFESLPLKERVRLLLPFAQSDPDVAAELERVNATLEQNPLLGFEPHAAQRDFIACSDAGRGCVRWEPVREEHGVGGVRSS
jgi:hypothetical protein